MGRRLRHPNQRTFRRKAGTSELGQELTSTDVPTGIRAAETFGQILSWPLETVRLRSAPEVAVGARAENRLRPIPSRLALGSLAEAFTCPVSSPSRWRLRSVFGRCSRP